MLRMINLAYRMHLASRQLFTMSCTYTHRFFFIMIIGALFRYLNALSAIN